MEKWHGIGYYLNSRQVSYTNGTLHYTILFTRNGTVTVDQFVLHPRLDDDDDHHDDDDDNDNDDDDNDDDEHFFSRCQRSNG